MTTKTYGMLVFFQPDFPASSALKDMLIDAYAVQLAGDVIGDEDTMKALIQAYTAVHDAWRISLDKEPIDTISFEEAERLFITHAKRGYREHQPNEEDDSESFPWWSELLPKSDGLYTPMLAEHFGYLAGYYEGRNATAMYEYMRKHREHDEESV